MRLARRLLCATVVVVVVLVASADAISVDGWTVQHVGRGPDEQLSGIALTGNPAGVASLAWVRGGHVRVAVARPGHRFTPPRLVPHSGDGSAPGLITNARGDTLVYWFYFDHTYIASPSSRDEDCCFGLRLTVLDRHGNFHGVQTLTPKGVDVALGGIAFDKAGRIGVVWSDYSLSEPALEGRFSTADGKLRRTTGIDRRAYGITLAYVRGRPHVLMVEEHSHSSTLLERSRDKHGAWAPRVLVASGLPEYPSVAADTNARGEQAVVWTSGDSGRHPVFAGTHTLGRRLRARRISTDSPSYYGPYAAIGPTGAAVVAWQPDGKEVVLSVRRPGRQFPHAYFLVRPAPGWNDVQGIQLAIDRLGRAVVAWWGQRNGHGSVFAAIRTRGGRRVHFVRLASGDDVWLDGQGTAAIDDRGRAIVAWVRPSRDRISVARAFAP